MNNKEKFNQISNEIDKLFSEFSKKREELEQKRQEAIDSYKEYFLSEMLQNIVWEFSYIYDGIVYFNILIPDKDNLNINVSFYIFDNCLIRIYQSNIDLSFSLDKISSMKDKFKFKFSKKLDKILNKKRKRLADLELLKSVMVK